MVGLAFYTSTYTVNSEVLQYFVLCYSQCCLLGFSHLSKEASFFFSFFLKSNLGVCQKQIPGNPETKSAVEFLCHQRW